MAGGKWAFRSTNSPAHDAESAALVGGKAGLERSSVVVGEIASGDEGVEVGAAPGERTREDEREREREREKEETGCGPPSFRVSWR